MLGFTLFIYKRWGALVPVLSTVGSAIGGVVGAALPLEGDANYAARFFLMAGVTFALLWLADWKIQEGSGEVHYDAENDCPVVYEESSGSWLFISFRTWMVLIPLFQAGFGVLFLSRILFGVA